MSDPWRKTLTNSALDSTAYREKLASVMETANSMHLSEAEAAERFGNLIAALIMLQRRTRVWLTERRKYKDSHKVVYRNSWSYSEQEPPEVTRQTARFREKRVRENGWRAPLNRRYAQLGQVHTALGRKPEGAPISTHEEDLRRAAEMHTYLNPGESKRGFVRK